MATNDSQKTHVKVCELCENRDMVDEYYSSSSDVDAGKGVKRRRMVHDYRKLSKFGYCPTVSNDLKQVTSNDLKGKKRKHSENFQELCVYGETARPPKLSKIWPVFDSGVYGNTMLTLRMIQKTPPAPNPLLFNSWMDSIITIGDTNQIDWFGGINASWKQTQMSNTIPQDNITKRIFSSVSRQLRIINAHFQKSMFRYKYPRVTRSNVLLESSYNRRPAIHVSLALRAIKFQATPRRELPCYGNLELPLQIKQERGTSQVFPAIMSVESETEKQNDVEIKVEQDTVKVEREKEKDKESDQERERDSVLVITPHTNKPRCGRTIHFAEDSVIRSADDPTPGTSGKQSCPKSLEDVLKELRASKVRDSKKRASLTPEQRKMLAEIKDKKEVRNFMMPDAPESKKGKGKGKRKGSDSRIFIPCPLLPGVPEIPPPRKPQPWEVRGSQETAEVSATGRSADTFVTNPVMETGEVSAADRSADTFVPNLVMETAEVSAADRSADTFVPNLVMETAAEVSEADRSADTFVATLFIENTVDYSDDEVIEGTPPEELQSRPMLNLSKEKYELSPSTRVIQSTELPVNPVWSEIELIGFIPQASTSKTAPRSGMTDRSYEISEASTSKTAPRSGMTDRSYEIDVDSEDELTEVEDSGSEAEGDGEAISRAMQDQVYLETDDIDTEADLALRDIAQPEDNFGILSFDWRGDPSNFQGVREVFTGPSGPTFDVRGLTPLEVFRKIWDADIVDHIVRETNRYAHEIKKKITPSSRMTRWVDTNVQEMWRFLSILMLQSLFVNSVEREYWYPTIEFLRCGAFGKIMSFNRFLLLKSCLHFVDNTLLPKKTSKLHKVMPILKHLNKKFSSLYLPEQNVAIDESLLLWKGRLSFAQMIATKKARVGIKSYELCESRTGYLWKMEVYTGKGQSLTREGVPEDEPESATSKIVFALMRPLFGRGHTIVMDNFYNAPLLSRILKRKHKTDTMGTLRLNREFVPEGLKNKNKKNMAPGEVAFSSTKDLSVVVWRDKNTVAMISTYHQPEVGGKEKYGYYKYKPSVVLDYNLSMGGVDRKDQMLFAFPMERGRNICWYKKLFRRLLNVSIHNALVIFNHGRTSGKYANRKFRMELVKEILTVYGPRLHDPPPPPVKAQMHLPKKNTKKQRCKLCAQAKVRRSTMWMCGLCKINLCIEDCYTVYHERLEE